MVDSPQSRYQRSRLLLSNFCLWWKKHTVHTWWTIATKIVTILGIAAGLDYMHDLGMCHRDLKPSNILFDSEFHPKICDFDVARSDDMSDDSSSMTVNVGTILYMAPEHYAEETQRLLDDVVT